MSNPKTRAWLKIRLCAILTVVAETKLGKPFRFPKRRLATETQTPTSISVAQ